MPRYTFGEFLLSPRRRLLLRSGRELPLIPRYFDLLVLLVERRHEALHRREIFDRVWSDVVVSESALSQAIRTIRRTLGDDSREPRFIRTVSRHGYRFVFTDVHQEDDEGTWSVSLDGGPDLSTASRPDAFEPLLARLTMRPSSAAGEEDQREAAELLHVLGTSEALARLGTRDGHARARALLRDVRWDSASGDRVPVVGAPAPFAVTRELVALRLQRARRLVALRWAGGSVGGGLAGSAAGAVGGLLLAAAPESSAPLAVAPVLAVIGGGCGALGGAGVGAGVCFAEAVVRSRRGLAVAAGAALGGGIIGSAVQWIGRWGLAAVVGLPVDIGGGLEGVVLGTAAGIGYARATPRAEGGLATPSGRARLSAAAIVAASCALGALALAWTGHPLVGGTIHVIARAAHGSQATLTPLGRLIGEPDFGPVSQAVLSAGEGALFGLGLTLGLARRPAS